MPLLKTDSFSDTSWVPTTHRRKTVLFLLDFQSDREPSSVKDTAELLNIFNPWADLGASMLQGPDRLSKVFWMGRKQAWAQDLSLNLQLGRVGNGNIHLQINFKL